MVSKAAANGGRAFQRARGRWVRRGVPAAVRRRIVMEHPLRRRFVRGAIRHHTVFP